MVSEKAVHLAMALISDGQDYNARVSCIKGSNPYTIARRFVSWTSDYAEMLRRKDLEEEPYSAKDILDAAQMVINHTMENVREWNHG